MFKIGKKHGFLFFFILLIFMLSGCTRLKMIDEKLGEIFFNKPQDTQTATSTKDNEESLLNFKVENYLELTKEQKERIDKFLIDNNLNRYGDESGTFYTGGTPLFNETTGESVDRFEYILKVHPEFFLEFK